MGFWDPLGLSSDGDLYSFKRRRSVELKHGRICMLEHRLKKITDEDERLTCLHPCFEFDAEATMGYITPEAYSNFLHSATCVVTSFVMFLFCFHSFADR